MPSQLLGRSIAIPPFRRLMSTRDFKTQYNDPETDQTLTAAVAPYFNRSTLHGLEYLGGGQDYPARCTAADGRVSLVPVTLHTAMFAVNAVRRLVPPE